MKWDNIQQSYKNEFYELLEKRIRACARYQYSPGFSSFYSWAIYLIVQKYHFRLFFWLTFFGKTVFPDRFWKVLYALSNSA